MRWARLQAANRLVIEDVEPPEPQDDEVLVRVEATGICGSDVSTYVGHHPFRKAPVVLGHEAAGRVVGLGAGAPDELMGRRIALRPLIPCGRCEPCQQGATNLCRDRKVPGIGWSGTFADYIVAPASVVHVVDDHVPAETAALIEPAAVALRTCRRAGCRLGSSLGVIGAGAIGALAARLAHELGSDLIVVSDVSQTNLDVVTSQGPCRPVLVPAQNPVDVVADLTNGRGLDATVVAAAVPDAIDQAVRMTRPGGVVVVVALFGSSVSFDVNQAIVREVDVRGSYVYTADDFATVVGMVNAGAVDLAPYVSQTAPLVDAPTVFAAIADGAKYVRFVLRPDRVEKKGDHAQS